MTGDPHIPHQKKERALCVSATNYRLKSEVSLSAMFNPLHSITNQQLFEKHLCNQSSHYEKYG